MKAAIALTFVALASVSLAWSPAEVRQSPVSLVRQRSQPWLEVTIPADFATLVDLLVGRDGQRYEKILDSVKYVVYGPRLSYLRLLRSPT